MKAFKRITSFLLVLIFAISYTAGAFAEEYDISIGSVSIVSDGTANVVTQENGVTNHVETSETVITGTSSDNTIRIDTSDGDVEVTLNSVNLTGTDETLLRITGDDNAEDSVTVNFKGDSVIVNSDDDEGIVALDVDHVTFNGEDGATLNTDKIYVDSESRSSNESKELNINALDCTVSESVTVATNDNASMNIVNSDVQTGSISFTGYNNDSKSSYSLSIDNSNVVAGSDTGSDNYPVFMLGMHKDDEYSLNIKNATVVDPSGYYLNVISPNFFGLCPSGALISIKDGGYATRFEVKADNKSGADSYNTALYKVVDANGNDISYTVKADGKTYVVTCDDPDASFKINSWGLNYLKGLGYEDIKFIAGDVEYLFNIDKALSVVGSEMLVVNSGKLTIGGVEKTL